MPLNIDYLQNLEFPAIRSVVTDKDAMFYALSIGLGCDPVDAHDLRYVYEEGLKIFPTMPIVIGHPGNWMVNPNTGITRTMVVHGGQRLTTERELPLNRPLVTTNRITQLLDKGDKGAIMVLERETRDEQSRDRIALSESTVFCRADGNFGGQSGPGYEFVPLPERPADRSIEIATQPNMALFYRLNHDRNPLHAAPESARKAGFDRPILHGLATYGAAAAAIARAFPDRTIQSFETRFSKPVLPGETITVELWEEQPGCIAFRARIAARQAVVLDRGRVEFRCPGSVAGDGRALM